MEVCDEVLKTALIVCLLVCVSGAQVALADSPFTPDEDIFGYIFSADINHNGLGLYADFTYNEGVGYGTAFITYLKFDLNNLSGPVGDATKIRLYTTSPAISPFNLSIWSVDDNWDKSTLTWTTAQSHPPIAKLDRNHPQQVLVHILSSQACSFQAI